MGSSTTGILFYGVLLPEDYPAPWLPREDDEDGGVDISLWWAKAHGFGDPGFDHNKNERWTPEEEALYTTWIDTRSEKVPPLPVKIGTHCSYMFPMYFIAVKDTYKWNTRGYGTPIFNLDTPLEGIKEVCEFCKQHLGVEVVFYDAQQHGPDHDFKLGWWLVSEMGS